MTTPDRIIPFQSTDKRGAEKWKRGRNLANFPRPYAMAFYGPPSSGKTCLALNIILKADPVFDNIVIVNKNGSHSTEWVRFCDDQEEENGDSCFSVQEYLPLPERQHNLLDAGEKAEQESFENTFDKEERNLLILDDFRVSNLTPRELLGLERILSFSRTHHNVSCMILSQSPFSQIQKGLRDTISITHVFPANMDVDTLSTLGRRVGLRKKHVDEVLKYVSDQYDVITFDFSAQTPAPIRKNLWSPIYLVDLPLTKGKQY